MAFDKKAYMKEYRKRNAEKLRQQEREYRAGNVEYLEKNRAANKRYYEENKDRLREAQQVYYVENRDKINEQKKSYYRNESLEQRAKRRKASKEWARKNADYYRQYYQDNKHRWQGEEALEKQRIWRKNNPEKVKKYRLRNQKSQLEWQRAKSKSDPKFRLDRAMSTALKRGIHDKGGKSWESLVGFSRQELRMHLEALFEPGMNCGNYGEWHVDHVVPLSWYSYESKEDDEFRLAWSLYNLQPMWAHDNCSKSDRFAGRVTPL